MLFDFLRDKFGKFSTINGKRRAEITVPKGTPAAEVEGLVLSLDEVVRILDGKAPKKIVVVQDRIVNVVV